MKFVVACDSFKGCMTSKEVGQTIEKGILKANFQHRVKVFSMADGGEGTAQAFCDVINGKMVDVNTLDAYHRKIRAGICLSQEEDIAIIEKMHLHPGEKLLPGEDLTPVSEETEKQIVLPRG